MFTTWPSFEEEGSRWQCNLRQKRSFREKQPNSGAFSFAGNVTTLSAIEEFRFVPACASQEDTVVRNSSTKFFLFVDRMFFFLSEKRLDERFVTCNGFMQTTSPHS